VSDIWVQPPNVGHLIWTRGGEGEGEVEGEVESEVEGEDEGEGRLVNKQAEF